MKQLALILICIVVASMLLPCTIVYAEPAYTPHEDPASAQSILDPYSFLAQYVDVLTLMSNRQYEDASKLAEQLSQITVPDDIRYIINRYNNITQQLINVLNDLQSSLDRASSLLDQYRLDEAGAELDRAGILVAKAQILLGELEDATTTLSQQLGVFAAPAESKIRQAYATLQNLINQLQDLIDQYHALLQRITQEEQELRAEQLEPTDLTLTLNTTSVFVGGVIAASGQLTSNGQSLANRTVTLLLDDEHVATLTTSSSGSFSAILHIPFKYVHSMTAQALYTPSGNDKGVYLAAVSPAISINVIFYDTELSVSVPNVAYPALPLKVSGTVTSEDFTPLNGRTIKIFFDDELLDEQTSDTSGAFSLQTNLNRQTETGSHNVTVTVDAQGVYAGASQRKTLTVTRIASMLEVKAPSFVLLPSKIEVTGTVAGATGPLTNAKITLTFASTTTVTQTSTDGSFTATIDVPLNTLFGGSQTLNVRADPTQPWQAATQTNLNIFVLNSVSVALALVSAISVAAVMYLRFAQSKARSKPAVKQESGQISESTAYSSGNPAVEAPSKPKFQFEGVKGKVLEAYSKVAQAIEVKTGKLLKPQMTLREFLHQTEPNLGEAVKPFVELTGLAEKTLYSARVPDEADVLKAEGLASEIGRMLK
jgi:hypothetical protein